MPTITGTTPGSSCGTGTVTLGATASAGTISWYSTSTGGTAIISGPSFTTPTISVSTTYYVDATNNTCTTASRTSVVASVNTTPTIISVASGTRCGTGTVSISAVASAGTVNWYTSATGGISIGSGASFTTPSISATTVYYVDATVGACPSSSRTADTAYIKTVPSINNTTPNSSCGPGVVSLSATASSGTISWFNVLTGGIPLTTGTTYAPNIGATQTYYVEASINGCTTATRVSILATINTVPAITDSVPTTICAPSTGTISATATVGSVNWFAAATGGISLFTGASFTTPTLSNTTTYYAEANNNGCLTSHRTPVIVNVNPATVAGTVTGGLTIIAGNNTGNLLLNGYTGSILWWERRTLPTPATWSTITNVTNNYNEILSTQGQYEYRVKVQSGICPAAYSVSDTVFVIADGINEAGNNSIQIYSFDKSIYIKNISSEDIQEVLVFNLMGEEVKHILPENKDLIQIQMNVSVANYLVKVITKNQAYTAKIFLK